MTYRDEVTELKKEASWTFWKLLPLAITVITVMTMLGFALNSAGLIGSTVVERVVMRQSFQYKEGMEQRAAILKANIQEINILISSNVGNKTDLINQRSILKSQLLAITINE